MLIYPTWLSIVKESWNLVLVCASYTRVKTIYTFLKYEFMYIRKNKSEHNNHRGIANNAMQARKCVIVSFKNRTQIYTVPTMDSRRNIQTAITVTAEYIIQERRV